ncbi:hypothetical protein P5V15_012805 [Pogonomyrmex californicus]
MRIIEKENTKLITLLTQVETLYKTTDKRRGLLDAVGSVSKILFGTMDADDQKLRRATANVTNKRQGTAARSSKSNKSNQSHNSALGRIRKYSKL